MDSSDHRVTGEVAGREPQQVGTPITPDSWNHVEYCRFKDWNICTPDHNNPICNLKCSQLLEMAL